MTPVPQCENVMGCHETRQCVCHVAVLHGLLRYPGPKSLVGDETQKLRPVGQGSPPMPTAIKPIATALKEGRVS